MRLNCVSKMIMKNEYIAVKSSREIIFKDLNRN